VKILLGISGGIAAYKTPELVRLLKKAGHQVRVACTRNALELVSRIALETVSGEPVLFETFTPRTHPGVEHIDLAGWPDAVVIAPATANVIAKLACGLADDFLTTVLLATPAPVWIAPGMNTRMWEHPATLENVQRLIGRGVGVIGPDSGELACGTSGPGRMSEPSVIVGILEEHFARPRPLAGRRVLITAGATREHLDPVRFISNPSTGRMGVALARAARELGAEVTLVHGHLEVPVPDGVVAVPAGSAIELHRAVFEWKDRADLLIMTAAVGDYMSASPAAEKMKKEALGATLTLQLVRTPDILAELAQSGNDPSGAGTAPRAPRPKLVGFAAETAGGDESRLLELARQKLSRKGCDALFANDVSIAGAGFAAETNQGVLLFADGHVVWVPQGTKDQVAASLLESVVASLLL